VTAEVESWKPRSRKFKRKKKEETRDSGKGGKKTHNLYTFELETKEEETVGKKDIPGTPKYAGSRGGGGRKGGKYPGTIV